ncbi:MAG: polysaccharide biosynthesis protein [bacterium]|nr:MAG: polysaccharide biosynthesis protein [bacterium]
MLKENNMEVPLLRLDYTDEEISEIKSEIEKVLRSGYLTMAERVKEFEELFASYCNTRFALGTNSGTSALEIALRAVDVEGGTVVLPSNTYMATPLATIKAGASVVFTDCERSNLQMDPDDLKNKIREDTKAVILVHIGGIISPRLKEIQEVCSEHEIPLIEDAAHAHGAMIDGRMAGSLGLAGAFSFYPTKVLTSAEGGMLVTDSENIYKKGTILREHGKADHRYNIHTEIGDNWRFSELHAVLGIQQMKKAHLILAERRRLAKLYDTLLEKVPGIKKVKIPPHIHSAYYKYIAFLPDGIHRQDVKDRLKKDFNVMLTGEVYSDPCHNQPVFQKYPEKKANKPGDSFPNTDYVCQQHICLPLYPGLKDEEADYVVSCLQKVIE